MIDYGKLIWMPLSEDQHFEVGMAIKTRFGECFLIGDARLFAEDNTVWSMGCDCCSYPIKDIVAIAYV